jgi:hypothetical protein
MTEDTALGTAPDITIREPSMTAGEAEMLLFALQRSRATFAWKPGAWTRPGSAGGSRRRR